jgi:hypothetical protein
MDVATQGEHKCEACEETVQIVNEHNECFACELYEVIFACLGEKMCEEHAQEMGFAIHEWVLDRLLKRFAMPGQEHPLAAELDKIMVPAEAVN